MSLVLHAGDDTGRRTIVNAIGKLAGVGGARDGTCAMKMTSVNVPERRNELSDG